MFDTIISDQNLLLFTSTTHLPKPNRANEWVGLWEAARHQPPEAVVGLAREWQMRGLLGEPRRGRRPATDAAARGPVCLARGDRAIRGPPVGECGFPPCGAQGQRGATAANGGSEGRLLRRARRGGCGHQLPANGPGPAALGDPGAACQCCHGLTAHGVRRNRRRKDGDA